MIRLTVLYPAADGATFDHDYYREKHIPLCVQTWGLDGAEIDRGIDGPYVAAVHFKFASPEARRRGLPRELVPSSPMLRTTRRSRPSCRPARSSEHAESRQPVAAPELPFSAGSRRSRSVGCDRRRIEYV